MEVTIESTTTSRSIETLRRIFLFERCLHKPTCQRTQKVHEISQRLHFRIGFEGNILFTHSWSLKRKSAKIFLSFQGYTHQQLVPTSTFVLIHRAFASETKQKLQINSSSSDRCIPSATRGASTNRLLSRQLCQPQPKLPTKEMCFSAPSIP